MKEQPIFKFALTERLIDYCAETGEDPNDWLPARANDTDTGWDVKCADPNGIELYHKDYAIIPLGFRVFSPDGWWLRLVPRSSTLIKKHIHALYGVIDETYEGEVGFCGQLVCSDRDARQHLYIPFGERIGQLIPVRRHEMAVEGISNEEFDKLCAERNASRGAGGFGSTGLV